MDGGMHEKMADAWVMDGWMAREMNGQMEGQMDI